MRTTRDRWLLFSSKLMAIRATCFGCIRRSPASCCRWRESEPANRQRAAGGPAASRRRYKAELLLDLGAHRHFDLRVAAQDDVDPRIFDRRESFQLSFETITAGWKVQEPESTLRIRDLHRWRGAAHERTGDAR